MWQITILSHLESKEKDKEDDIKKINRKEHGDKNARNYKENKKEKYARNEEIKNKSCEEIERSVSPIASPNPAGCIFYKLHAQ